MRSRTVAALLALLAVAGTRPAFTAEPARGLTIIVPGTWARGFVVLDDRTDWAAPGTPFNTAVSATFGMQAIVLEWSGANSRKARADAARALKALVDSYALPDDAPLNIVAHSHGGNVVKAYTNLPGARRITNLVCLGAPQRTDYRIDAGHVRVYDNVYSLRDPVQISGGPLGSMTPAPRVDPAATNIDETARAASHSDLHTEPVWRDVEARTGGH